MNKIQSTKELLNAAKLSRRTVMKAAAAVGAGENTGDFPFERESATIAKRGFDPMNGPGTDAAHITLRGSGALALAQLAPRGINEPEHHLRG